MKNLMQVILSTLARAILKKYTPEVVGVTGSVGKSSSKEAIFYALHQHFAIRRSQKSYNNELGVPLTIIGADTQGKSISGWLGVILKALKLIIIHDAHYPRVLVVEMGADYPGNIASLVKLVSCKVGVVTAVGPTHLEQLGTVENVLNEKMTLVRTLKGADSIAVVNVDDELIREASKGLKVKTLRFGKHESADVRLVSIKQIARFLPAQNDVHCGLQLEVAYSDTTQAFFFSGLIGEHQAYSVLAGLAVGIGFGLTLGQMATAMEGYKTPNGRMRVMDGIKRTLVIDDTYNASPKAVKAALDTLLAFEIAQGARRIAVLGHMAELGEQSEVLHREVGEYVVGKADILITSGEKAKVIGGAAEAAGMDKSSIMCFTSAQDAGLKLQDLMEMGDVVLIKGSQSARMERVVKEVMAEPERAKELLVRQSAEWEGK